MGGCSSGRSADTQARLASQICESFQLPAGTPANLKLGIESATTAGTVTILAKRLLGHGLSPWDWFPSNHFVAECGFAKLDATPTNSPTTVCPNGSILYLTPTTSAPFYVDEHNHWSLDPMAGLLDHPEC